jgi:prepilin peptidase CpaA
VFGDSGMGLAILDGFLFGLAGGLAGFALFTLMFAVQVVRGGDVKLAAAIGAWLGPYYICWFLLATVIVLPLWFILKLMVVLLNGVMNPSEPNQAQSKKTENASKKSRVTEGKSNTSDTTQPKPSLRVLTFSAPAAISACIVLLWMGRFDLELMNRPKPPEGVANANAATN